MIAETDNIQPALWTLEQTAKRLGLLTLGLKDPSRSVRSLIKRGRLRGRCVAGRKLVVRSSVEEYLAGDA